MTAPVNRQIVLTARPQGLPKAGDPPDPGPRYLFSMIANRVLMQGFIISDHLNLYPEFLAEVSGWRKARRIKSEETVVEGIENAPEAFLGLFSGDNLGKMVVRLASDSSAPHPG
jgi:NADPH-dependent curcumin reductase CurA